MQFYNSSRRRSRYIDTRVVKINVFRKFCANNIASYRRQHFSTLNREGITNDLLLTILLTISKKSYDSTFWEVINPFFISKSKFGSFKNPFTSPFEFKEKPMEADNSRIRISQ